MNIDRIQGCRGLELHAHTQTASGIVVRFLGRYGLHYTRLIFICGGSGASSVLSEILHLAPNICGWLIPGSRG